MPPSNEPAPTNKPQHARKKTAPIIPAIPLALSKPRPKKNQLKTNNDVEAGAGNETPVETPTETPIETPVVEQQAPQQLNGFHHDAQINGDSQSEAQGNEMRSDETPGNDPTPVPMNATPDMPVDYTNRSSTSSTQVDAGAPVSPATARRFDMRHIRTELPPAFVPSAEQHTPRSAASSQFERPPMMYSHAHPAHPSTSSIVFGGQDSSTSSPVPPQSAGSAFNPPPFPTLNGNHATQSVPNGHAHHASEPYGSSFHPPGLHQPAMRQVYPQSSQPGPSFNAHGHTPFRYPPREPFTPTEPQHLNGNPARSTSQASSAAAEQQILQSPTGLDPSFGPRRFDHQQQFPRQTRFPQHMPPPPQQSLDPDMVAQLDNAEALRQHLLSHFGSPESTDTRLLLAEDYDGPRYTFEGHSMVLSRSPMLQQLRQANRQESLDWPTVINVQLRGRYLKLASFNAALRYLYGGPLLQLDHHRPGSSAGERFPSNFERMENALEYVATGLWLQMPVLANRGVEVAGNLLHWDTIPVALAFALEGGLSTFWAVDDGSEEVFSAASSDDSLGRPEITGMPTHDPFATHLLQRIIDFTVHMFPPNFYLDTSAPQLDECPRLPSVPRGHESRDSRSDPRLSQIRFGEVPVDRPSFTTTTISAILLSLPFQLLKYVLEHGDSAMRLGPETASSIMRSITGERELRRLKAQKAYLAGQVAQTTDPRLVQNLYWEELVESSAQHRVGFRMMRRKKGMDTPSSSGASSERNK